MMDLGVKAKNILDELDHLNKVVPQFNITEKPKDLEAMISNGKNVLNALAKKSNSYEQ